MRNVTTWGPTIAIVPIRDEKLEKKELRVRKLMSYYDFPCYSIAKRLLQMRMLIETGLV